MTPKDIKQARLDAGLTCAQAARLVGVTTGMWFKYESGSNEMPLYRWELFQYKLNEVDHVQTN